MFAYLEATHMCGIAGFLGRFDESTLQSMSDAVAHRGPDDQGTFLEPRSGVGLAHRRLSIIDLSSAARQPMTDGTGRAVIVFNGEIYNYRELRDELLASGVGFHTQSDTEVLLNLYLRDGCDMLARLNGIYAFAIWDTRDRLLFLARDGVGVKPLYYTCTRDGLAFASELKAILRVPGVHRALDPDAVSSYLTYLWCPAPKTMLREVKKLEPGHAMVASDGRIARTWQFYDLPYRHACGQMREEEARAELRRRVQQAVRRQMVADVPVGAFLSGGLDSSAVALFASELTGESKLQCFTIGFKGDAAQREGMTEDLPYAERIARRLGVDLHTVWVGPEMADHLEEMIYHLDEPQADPAPINALFISRLARSHGIKVLLSGAGGDDIFSGYRRHAALAHEKYWSWMPGSVRSAIAGAAASASAGTTRTRRISKALQYADLDGDERIASYFYWTPPGVLSTLLTPQFAAGAEAAVSAPLLRTLAALPAGVDPMNKMLYLEGKHFLADHNLNYTDKMGMAAGVEVRVPLLDPDLVEFAAALPVDLKQRGREGKYIFKKAMEGYLPLDVIYRPKTGFGAPLRHWLRHSLRPLVEELLSVKSLANRGLFQPSSVRDLLTQDREGRVDGTYILFSIMCIELWCRIFLDRQGVGPTSR